MLHTRKVESCKLYSETGIQRDPTRYTSRESRESLISNRETGAGERVCDEESLCESPGSAITAIENTLPSRLDGKPLDSQA